MPVPKQRSGLIEAGVPERVIYSDPVPDHAIRSLREGDELCVAGSLRVLGGSRDAIAAAVDEVHARGAVVVDVVNGRRTGPGDGARMMADAVAEIAQDRRRGIDPVAAARKRWGKRDRLPEAEARDIWFNRATYRTVPDALAAMPGWTRPEAYRRFGPRDVRLHRPKDN